MDVTKSLCFEIAGHFLLTLFLQLKTLIQQEILVYMILCKGYMQHALPNTVSVSQNCRPLQTESEIQNQLM
jgi:hypothetical protein